MRERVTRCKVAYNSFIVLLLRRGYAPVSRCLEVDDSRGPGINAVDSSMTHPYSIYIWQPPLSPTGVGSWNEPVQCYTEQWAVYVAGLMHQDSRSVIKVVRYGLNLACFPDEHSAELVEKRIAQQWKKRLEDEE
jgi:hypothetical protein